MRKGDKKKDNKKMKAEGMKERKERTRGVWGESVNGRGD